jgi:hypothetical protein
MLEQKLISFSNLQLNRLINTIKILGKKSIKPKDKSKSHSFCIKANLNKTLKVKSLREKIKDTPKNQKFLTHRLLSVKMIVMTLKFRKEIKFTQLILHT